MHTNEEVRFAQLAFDFCEKVNQLTDSRTINAATLTAISQFGFEYATCAVVPTPGVSSSGGVLLNNRPAAYTERYVAENYAAIDPVIIELRHTIRPFSWSDVRGRRQLTGRQCAIIDEGRDFGAHDGLVIPILTQGGLSIFAPCGLEPNLTARARSAVEIVGMTAHQALRRAEFNRPAYEQPLLTPREREVLLWVAKGKSNGEIGIILSMNPLTAKQHIANAMKKMGVYQRTLAAMEAIRLGEICP